MSTLRSLLSDQVDDAQVVADSDQFLTDLGTELASYQGDHPELEKYSIVSVDSDNKFAIVLGFVFDSGLGTSTEKQYIFIENNDGTWLVRELVRP